MLARALGKALQASARGLASFAAAEAPAAARLGALPSFLEAARPTAAAFPWPIAAAWTPQQQQQQPVSLSPLAAALLQQPSAPAAGGLRAPQQGVIVEWRADSVRRKRKRAMNKHKHRKRRKLNRMRK